MMTNKPQLLDLFCKAGGCSRGYQMAGFYVVGVDIEPQPRYIGDEFIQADALEYLAEIIETGEIERFTAVHASPPCQRYSRTKSMTTRDYPDLVEPVRELLRRSGKTYVIENVPDAPLENPLMLCGSMFPGLRVYRHRLFECDPPIYFPPAACNHSFKMPPSKGEYHRLDDANFITCVGNNFEAESGRIAMGIDWMTRAEMAEAIPPAYTEWLGGQLLVALRPLGLGG